VTETCFCIFKTHQRTEISISLNLSICS